jgi:hypothetical protein
MVTGIMIFKSMFRWKNDLMKIKQRIFIKPFYTAAFFGGEATTGKV